MKTIKVLTIAALTLLILLPAVPVSGRIIRVPSEYSTIQNGLDHAARNDTVLVSEGTYRGAGNVDLDFMGKPITLLSEMGAVSTIIDCENNSQGFNFHLGEGNDSRVEGFTITNGYAVMGGGIQCTGTFPTISNCRIIANRAAGDMLSCAYGGGIYGSPVITGCTISENSSYSDVWKQGAFGGGIYGSPYVMDTVISGNYAVSTDVAGAAGGGVYCSTTSGSFENCEISGNRVLVMSDLGNASGGGISGSPFMSNCIISGNFASSGLLSGGGSGGGLAGSPTLENCIITGNTATGEAGLGDGGGIFGAPVMTNCFVFMNTALSSGGGIYCNDWGSTIIHCTICNNNGGSLGGGIYSNFSVSVSNSIVWANDPCSITGNAEIVWSDIQGGFEGEGNIDTDPYFCACDDPHIASGSPCIDSCPDVGIDTDIDGESRPWGSGFDMGADESTTSGAQIRIDPERFLFLSLDGESIPDTSFTIKSIGSTGLTYSITNEFEWMELSGRLNARLPSGKSTVITVSVFPAGLETGVYRDTIEVSSNDPHHQQNIIPVELIVYSHGLLKVPEEFSTIQSAIDASEDGDMILVAPGEYTGSGNYEIDFKGKAIHLISSEGPEKTIIDCNMQGRGINFVSGEDTTSIISGFTITGGSSWETGGGIQCTNSSPTIKNCIISGCISQDSYGGGIFCKTSASPHIYDCIIKGNSASRSGGGICLSEFSDAILTSCEITDNICGESGGGLFISGSSPIINSCLVLKNFAATGGGIASAHTDGPLIVNSNIAGNGAGLYGGIRCGSQTILIVHSNVVLNSGSGCCGLSSEDYSAPKAINSIFWKNSGHEIEGGNPDITYCDVQDSFPGTGNINSEPYFKAPAAGDFHLLPASPCVDAATPTSVTSDIDGDPRPIYEAPDIGSDEVNDIYPRIRVSPDSLEAFSNLGEVPNPDTLTIHSLGYTILNYSVLPDSSSWMNITGGIEGALPPGEDAFLYIEFDPTGLSYGDYRDTILIESDDPDTSLLKVPVHLSVFYPHIIHVPGDAPTIQDGIDAAMKGDTVLVASGSYSGEGNFELELYGKQITISSASGPDSTVIMCEQRGRGVSFVWGEKDSTVFEGFTIMKGYYKTIGGGILVEGSSNPTIRNCKLIDCSSKQEGGAISIRNSNPTLEHCRLLDNSSLNGGGIYLLNANPTVSGCEFRGNSATKKGGAILMEQSSPVFMNCFITENAAEEGGGCYCNSASPLFEFVTFTANDSSALKVLNSDPEIINSIIWDNITSIDLVSGAPSITWTDIEGGWSGTGNLDVDPLFKSGIDFHLTRLSPCIDAGNESDIHTDLDGDTRPLGAGNDMGADEFVFTGPVLETFPSILVPAGFLPEPEHDVDTLIIFNPGGDTLLYNINQPDEQWVRANGDMQGRLAPGDSSNVFLHYFISDFTIGSYTDTLRIGSNDPVHDILPVPINLTIGQKYIEVPGDYETIQEGIDAALPGQEIWVTPGTYSGEGNRDLDFGGKPLLLKSEEGPLTVTIELDNEARFAHFMEGESRSTKVSGLTIVDGSGHNGGAILISGASPSIVNCIFTSNSAITGGVIGCMDGAYPVIDSCSFSGNVATDAGGSIYAEDSSPAISNCSFSNSYSFGDGGAIYLNGDCTTMVDLCDFSYNTAVYRGGAAACSEGASPVFQRCVFATNSALRGAALVCFHDTAPTVTSCTFYRNEATDEGGALHTDRALLSVINSIMRNDIPDEVSFMELSPEITYSDIQGGWEGSGNIDEPPLFNLPGAGDFTLKKESPCIDAGDPDYEIPSGGGYAIDMGAFEYYWGFSIIRTDPF